MVSLCRALTASFTDAFSRVAPEQIEPNATASQQKVKQYWELAISWTFDLLNLSRPNQAPVDCCLYCRIVDRQSAHSSPGHLSKVEVEGEGVGAGTP